MPKKKVRKSAAKRFKVTKTGKVMFVHQYGSHKKLNKSKRRLRRQKEPAEMIGKFAKKIKRMLAVG
ncbi:MAG TPA: bL35 family ribosomal protein [Candidatus Saccharimonadales bacterium]|nr:bL35 family ribosomal protein [Candidatus Saccharimonadales bacterium]